MINWSLTVLLISAYGLCSKVPQFRMSPTVAQYSYTLFYFHVRDACPASHFILISPPLSHRLLTVIPPGSFNKWQDVDLDADQS
jgi:hypothetical protein